MGMSDSTRNNLKTWLEKSLANHHEDGLVAYVEAIVGDAEEADDDLREKWTDKLDDFLSDSSADFVEHLLRGVRTGSFGQVWRGGQGGVDEDEDRRLKDTHTGASYARIRDESDDVDDSTTSGVEAGEWNEQKESLEEPEEYDDDEEDDRRSRRNRRRGREEEKEPQPEVVPNSIDKADDGTDKGDGRDLASSKRQRVQGGKGLAVGTRNTGKGAGRGAGRADGPGQLPPPVSGPMVNNQGSGRGGTGRGSLAPTNQGIGNHQQGSWGPGRNGGMGRGMPPSDFPPQGFPGPGALGNNLMRGPPMPMGPGPGLVPGMPAVPPMEGARPGGNEIPVVFNGTQPQPRRTGGLLPTPNGGRGFPTEGPRRGGIGLLPEPLNLGSGGMGPLPGNGGMGPPPGNGGMGPPPGSGGMGPRPINGGMGLLGPPRGFDESQSPNEGYLGPGGPVGPRGSVGPGGRLGPGGAVGPGGRIGPGGAVGPGGGVGPNTGVGGRGPSDPRGPLGRDGPVGHGSVGPRGPVGPKVVSGPVGLQGGYGGGPGATGNPGPGIVRDEPGPMIRGRDSGPMIDRSPQGRSPDMGARPGTHTLGGRVSGPGFHTGAEGGGSGSLRTAYPDGRADMHERPGVMRHGPHEPFPTQSVHDESGAFNGEMERGVALGPRRGPREGADDRHVLHDRPGPELQDGPGGIRGHQARGQVTHQGMGGREGQGLRNGPDLREGADGRQGLLRHNTESRQAFDGSDGYHMRTAQDMRQSPHLHDGHRIVQGTADSHNMPSGDGLNKNGRSVFDRLGAHPGTETREGQGQHPSTLGKRGHSPEMQKQQPARDIPIEMRLGPNVRGSVPLQRGMQEGQNSRRQEISHGQDLNRDGGARSQGEDSRRRQDMWPGPGRRGEQQTLGMSDPHTERNVGPGRPTHPRIGQDFNHGEVRGMVPGEHSQSGEYRGPAGLRGGAVPPDYSFNDSRLQHDPRTADTGHVRLREPPRVVPDQRGPSHDLDRARGAQMTFGHGSGAGGSRDHQQGRISGDSSSPSRSSVAPDKLSQAPPRLGMNAPRTHQRDESRLGTSRSEGMGFKHGSATRGSAGETGGGGGTLASSRGAGGALAWGGFGVRREDIHAGRSDDGRVPSDSIGNDRLGLRSGQGPRQLQRGVPDRPSESLSSARGDSNVRGPDVFRGRPPASNEYDGHIQPKREDFARKEPGSMQDPSSTWEGPKQSRPQQVPHDDRHASGRRVTELPPSERMTVRCEKIPSDVERTDLLHHFMSFGKVVDIKLRNVQTEKGGKGEKEVLVQFASADQARACISSPRAVLGNRFIVVAESPVNLHAVDQGYVNPQDGSVGSATEAAAARVEKEAAAAAATARAEAAAALAAKRKSHEQELAKASKTQEVVDQQLALEHLKLRVKDASKQLTKNRDIRDKIQGFLKMMDEKCMPEGEKAPYRKKLDIVVGKVVTLETEVAEVDVQSRALADLEAEARAMGATVPPPPNPMLHNRSTAELAPGGRGFRGRGHISSTSTIAGRGTMGHILGTSQADSEARMNLSLDHRPTTVKVSGLPTDAGESDLRLHASCVGLVISATMLDTLGDGVVKFAERRSAEIYISKRRSFNGVPLVISWHTAPNSGSRLTGDTSQGSIREAHNQLHPASRRVQPSATRGGRHNTSFPGRGADYGHRRWEGDFGGAGRGGDYRRAGEGGDYGAAGRGMTRPADRDSGRDGGGNGNAGGSSWN